MKNYYILNALYIYKFYKLILYVRLYDLKEININLICT